MATMSITLPEPLKDWVEDQTRSGRYGDASDYVRELIRRDQERQDLVSEMQKLIDEGFASGVSTRSMDEILEEARARVGSGAIRHGL